jgi:hypothetical protein
MYKKTELPCFDYREVDGSKVKAKMRTQVVTLIVRSVTGENGRFLECPTD